jgi:hypothetical protein
MKPGWKKTFKIAGIALGAVLLLVIAAVLVALFDKPLVRGLLLKQLNKTAGTTARLGRLDYKVFPLRVTVEDLDLGQEDAFQKIGVTLPRLQAQGSFWRIIRGAKPAFDVLEADGLVFHLEQKAVSEAPLDIEKILLQVSDMLAWTRRVALKKAGLSISLLGGRTEVRDLDLVLTPGPERDVVGYEIGSASISLQDKTGAQIFASGLSSSGRLSLASPYDIACSFSLDKSRWTLADVEESLDSLSLDATGRFDKSAQELTVSRLRIDAPGLIGLEGKAAGKLGYGLFIQAEAGAKLESLAAAAVLLRPLLPPALRDSPWAGRAELDGKYMIQRSDQGSKDDLTASLSFDGVELAPVVEGRPLPVRAAGRIDAAGPSADPLISVDIESSLGPVAAAGATIAGAELHLVASGSRSAADVTLLDARLSHLVYGASAGRRLAFDKASLTAKGSVDLAHKQGLLASLDARLAGLAYDVSAGQRIAFDQASLIAKGRVDLDRRRGDLTSLDLGLSHPAYDLSPGRRLAFDSATLAAKGSVDLAHKQAVLESLEARLPGLTPLRLSGRYGLEPNAPAEIAFDARGLDLPALRAMAGPFIPSSYAAWDLGGSLDLALEARRPSGPRSDWRFAGTVSLAGAKFNDPSFTIAGDGLDPILKIEGSGSPERGLSLSGSLDITKGESLWKAVYVAWAQHPLKLTAAGRYEPGAGTLDGLTARAVVPQVGAIDVKGQARLSPAPSFDLTVEAGFSLAPLYSLYTQTGVAEEARTKLEGSLAATLALHKTADGLSVGGRLKLADTNIEQPGSKTLLLGLAADVPIRYDSRPASALPSAAASPAPLLDEGHFHIGELQSPFLTLSPIDIALRAGVNALAIEPLSLPLFGGRLELGRTAFRLDPATGSVRGLGSLILRDIDISKFPIQSPQFKLTGKIQADFPRLDIATDKIAIEGRGEAGVFGGQIVLRDLAVADPFTEGRAISLDMDLIDLDMKKLTDEVPFGEVTGVVRGEVRGLVITYGQPESFSFRLESVPRSGVAQTFSLKAVDNLTVLSSGQKASGGTSAFWMRFVRGFRYQKLGIVSTLHNDTFTLNGTIHEGGIEYLVKKPALFGISVVNRDPSKSISFKEMVSRLRRIGQTGG